MNKAMDTSVPSITVTGTRVQSDANVPRHMPDTAACWPDADMKRARKLLKDGTPVTCADATSWTAMTALALQMLMSGISAKAALSKDYSG